MIECPSCGHQHRPGTLFCSECGVYLLTGGPLRTEPLPESDLPSSRADPWESGDQAQIAEAQTETLIFIIPPSGRQLALPADGEAVGGATALRTAVRRIEGGRWRCRVGER